ncbi:MAG TPA: peptide chain release factor 1 [Marinilabiliales bacterium]|nr:MAG: peptide chain release factor 1 [Bacteroidetes bacterium GWC2_40_13]OFX72290.1 MAG: peptide chain release factor 1 [Bacteroidetes bacterium GWD2_40_43]OFX90462.1 MAG: peptide chain release factor 1 [Bacteroidetes bacterium GWE2_40_63]OFY17292.1 MAG: peptide chain release factor 1 [Bacteroidetes bacterium GWF2_40_13]OFZ29122.1 MAG: peptide chain release factor 1 [Bacteroidetes bacterium RIFOXYC2_FULL_40_12]HAN00858.1 peptide chain release factor 1 [Marinilabiliales bacterium]
MADNMIFERLEGVKIRFEEVAQQINDPSVMSDVQRFIKLNKEYKNLEPLMEAYKNYKNVLSNISSARDILNLEKDEEMREMAKLELEELESQVVPMEEEIKLLLLPADPEDEKNAILEIRAGTGGDEASLFAGDLFRMYTKFCEQKGWKMEVTNISEGTSGGYKEIVTTVSGAGVYGILKYESGVHRVQRVPQTETQGRVHTSAATVAVLPEAEDFDVELKESDIRKDTYCSSGPGGQSVNTTYSAVRLTHIPSGIVVTCQDQKSQIKNLDKAMKELKTRLYNLEYQKYLDKISSKRKTMVSTGDRSAKIRTYNWPQGRVTDHRINLTMYNLQAIINGDIHEIIDKLQLAENAERLKEAEV